jgi:phosphoglycolate phosphatase
MVAPFVVGFDLDLTLIDSRPGIAAAFRELSARTGVYVDADGAVTRLGPPLDVELDLWFPPEEIDAAGELYRTIYPEVAITASPALPGAIEAFAAVRDQGGEVVVITGKHEANARLHLAHLGLEADAVIGWAWAEAKTAAMTAYGVGVYVGDHPADMLAARSVAAVAGPGSQRTTVAIGVLTGDHSAAELASAGADLVLPDLTGMPSWLRSSVTFGYEPAG